MDHEFVSIERRGRIAIVRFDRGTKSNALSYQVLKELTQAMHSFDDDYETSAVVLSGLADVFTYGMQLDDPDIAGISDKGLSQRRVLLQTGPRLARAMEDMAPLVIAAIEGWCVGGGIVLATNADLRITGKSATYYVPEIERGMNMSWGSVPKIAHLVGPARAKRIIILAEKINAETALEWGLSDAVVEDGGALDAAIEWAEKAAAMPPAALRMCKATINAATNALDRAITHADMDQFALAMTSEDYAEGVNSFLQKRPPKYTGK
jgi:enoyl-CoA hydratase